MLNFEVNSMIASISIDSANEGQSESVKEPITSYE